MKRLLFFICTLLCANVLFAQIGTRFWGVGVSVGLIYEITSTNPAEVEVDEAQTWLTTSNIPSTVSYRGTAYSVTSIGGSAFRNCEYLTSVTIPNSVTSIGDRAFSDCSSLTSVNIPNGVTSIGDRAFSDCSSLTSVNIPNGVTSIGDYAFRYCSSLTSVTIPNGVTSIGVYAFDNCSSLTSVTIPNGVTSIGDRAFSDCSSLTSVNIGNGVTSIGDSAFYHCSGLTSVTIPNSVTTIGDDAFRGCSSLTSVTIGNSVTTIGDYAFIGCSSLTSVTIPNSVTSIGRSAFNTCSSLTSITIPNSVTYIGGGAFCNCSSLTSITIPNSVTYLGSMVFWGCSSLTSVTIPNSVTSIGNSAFRGCSSLISVTIPNSVTSIEGQAFSYCWDLISVTCLAINPPELDESSPYSEDVFYRIGSPSTLYVPNGCRQAYENSSWAQYFDCIVELGSGATSVNLDVEVNNEEWGSVEVNEGDCGTATLRAVAEMDCSEFLRWSDCNTNNPRVVNVASDTSFTAIFKDPVLDTTINATIMQGETYNFNGQELSEEGVYNATVLSVLGCEINLTVNLDVIPNNYTNGETSSLQETELEEIVFYPNPTKGLISFSKTIERIEVVDISGKILLSFSNVREINIGDLPAGSYLLRLHSNENSVLRKIVKE